jgi:8-oxo-(d)GTP phosphatase
MEARAQGGGAGASVSAPILLVRHASAGDRSAWDGDDRDRPLDSGGLHQAEWLANELAGGGVGRVLSSPYARCLQTVAPLAQRLRRNVEPRAELAEGASRPAIERFLCGLVDEPATPVLCTHGDVMEALLGDGRPCAKGGVWRLEWRDGHAEPARYLAPPGE